MSTTTLTKKSIREYKTAKAQQSEINFSDHCQQRKIKCVKLDAPNNQSQRRNFLIQPSGKCPDFLCKVEGKNIFVEVKTLINFTGAAREKSIKESNKASRVAGNFIHFSPLFEPIPELKRTLKTSLKDVQKKFKNIKEEYKYPCVMLLCDVFGIELIGHQIFLDAYESYMEKDEKLVYCGWQKTEREQGLFDKIGSNVSAVVFWNEPTKCFNYIANPKAKIYLSKRHFNLFFII